MTTAAKLFLQAALLFAAVAAVSAQCNADSSVKYLMRAEFSWSSASHPGTDVAGPYPEAAHWPAVCGWAHNDSYSLWAPGDTANDALKWIAEEGPCGMPVIDANEQCINDKYCQNLFDVKCDEMAGTCTAEWEYEVWPSYPYVSWASMAAPSPDWYTGVYDVNLCEGSWATEGEMELYPYDAGTDAGATWTGENAPEDERKPIMRLDMEAPENGFWTPGGGVASLGTFSYTLMEDAETTAPTVTIDEAFFLDLLRQLESGE